jgi:subtilisin
MPVVSAELPEAAIAQLRKRADVTYVEDDNEWHALSQTAPWGINRIHAPSAWSVATGAGVNVAVLDSGIDYDHEDLAGNFDGGINWVGKGAKKDGSTDPARYNDVYGHGTHCAGTIAAVNNGIGVVGVAPEARIWAVKVLGDNGYGSWTDIAQGVEWCIEKGDIRVISMSLGGDYSSTLENACAAAYAANILIVASAGNDAGAVGYPAAYDSVMAVSSINSYDQLASSSNRGPEIELAAPGVGVLSTVPGDGYATKNGTSMACPHVSGVAALLWQSMSSASSIWNQLTSTAEDIGLTSDQQGSGLVDAAGAVGISQVTDLVITSVLAPEIVVEGAPEQVYVYVVVKNMGNQDVAAGVGVTLKDITESITTGTETTSSTLAPGDSEMLTLPYTTSLSIGEHTIEASHDLADDNPTNDSMTATVMIEASFRDIAITAVSAPSSAMQGDVVSVDVTVENVGNRNFWGVISVDLKDGEVLIDTKTVDILYAGRSTVVSFDWDTTTAGPGEHTLTASHDVIDDNESNDSGTTTVDITEPGGVEQMYASVVFATAGPHLKTIITVEESDQTPVAGIEVYATLDGEPLPVAVTDSAGQVTYTLKGGASSDHPVLVYDLLDTRDPAAYVAAGLPVTGLWRP